MKRVLYLSFYFEPDLCAGSFRNTPLAYELANQLGDRGTIDVITTLPNRYSSFDVSAPVFEKRDNLNIHRIPVKSHKNGFLDQILTFRSYFSEAKKIAADQKYDLVFASSSRLFTAYLGYSIAKSKKIPLYLDIRDIFTDTMHDVLNNKLVKGSVLPVLKHIENRIFGYANHVNLISEGFRSYFDKYKRPVYSSFPNGIDPEFLNLSPSVLNGASTKIITYAGNIGEGQGLHKIIPQAARKLGSGFKFIIIGDGGAKQKLIDQIALLQVSNVEIIKPVARDVLLEYYQQSDYLFIHLNDYNAFKRVLPSKVFELGAYDKPIIAGVGGYASQFISTHLSNSIVFPPGDADDMVKKISNYSYTTAFRRPFIEKFRRDNINSEMSKSILSYLK